MPRHVSAAGYFGGLRPKVLLLLDRSHNAPAAALETDIINSPVVYSADKHIP